MTEIDLVHAMIPTRVIIKVKDDEKRPRREPFGKTRPKQNEKDSDNQPPTEHIDEYA